MFSLFKKPEEEIIAVFDIGNGSIGGALVKMQLHDHPIVLYSHREPITFLPHPSSQHLLGSMLKLLRSVATHVAKEGLAHIKTTPFGGHSLKDAFCIYAAPWYISQTKIIKTEQEKPFAITQDLINSLVKKEQEQFTAALENGKYNLIFGPDSRLLEKKVIDIKGNGYEVDDPIGKKVKELELTVFSSFASHNILEQVEKTLHDSFAVRKIHHSSYALVSWYASRTLYPDLHDYFFVDVSGETTDVSLIVRDVLVETMSFPLGRSSLLRRVVKEMGVTPDVALSYVGMHFAGKLEKSFSDQLAAAIKPLEEDWRDHFISALSTFKKIYSLPRATLITADLDTSKFFLTALEKECPAELNMPKGWLALFYIGADTAHPHVYHLDGVVPDSFISLESIFLNTVFAQSK